ncbi:aldehyde dehydrogenase family 6 member b2 [Gigaspora margarita]|uniref:Aldehyde dehydrogenase family 6 member b2 n=1 Tax=Gigaspora margarita TaxID=4874 RepID=A0A8H4AVB0_GIGMA|nr:aldehyde dehydrogenase family 6 member b2 [Gigaspora margarita]
MSNENIFDDLEFDDLELCFDSNDSLECCFNNNDNIDFFDEILDNNGQLIVNNEEDFGLSNCKVNDLTNENEGLYPLNKGQSFKDWNEVESISWLSKHGCKQGFAFSLIKSELDKTDRIPRYRVYYCSKGRRYEPQKKAHVLEERNKPHDNNECAFHLNLQRWKSDNQIHISGIISTHHIQ